MKYILLSLLMISSGALATKDVDDPKQALDMIRLFLSTPKVAEDIREYARHGCIWKSEIIWASATEQVTDKRWSYGGGFTLVFSAVSGREVWLPYKYTMEFGEGPMTLKTISRDSIISPDLDCV